MISTARPRILRFLLLALFTGATGYFVAVQGISYRIIGYRDYDRTINQAHLVASTSGVSSVQPASAAELRTLVLSRTADALSFQPKYSSVTNPNQILDNKGGHCKMYAYVFTSAYNQLAKQRGLQARSKVAYGHVYWFGINLHQFTSSPFFRDHDFCVIRDDKGIHAVDAIMYDYLRIGDIRIRS